MINFLLTSIIVLVVQIVVLSWMQSVKRCTNGDTKLANLAAELHTPVHIVADARPRSCTLSPVQQHTHGRGVTFSFLGAVTTDDRQRRGCSSRRRSREAAAGDVKRIYGYDVKCISIFFHFHFSVAHAHTSVGCICRIVAHSRPFSWQETLYSEAVTDLVVPTPDNILPIQSTNCLANLIQCQLKISS